MARVKLSEYRAKKILVSDYSGFSLHFDNISDELENLPVANYVLKVDQGIKKRGKQGLVAVNITTAEVQGYAEKWKALGFDRYILEPFFEHTDQEERYLSLERTRSGIEMHFSVYGGIDVEDNAASIQRFGEEEIMILCEKSGISQDFITNIITKMDDNHISFVEFNPIVLREGKVFILDAAVLLDSAGEYFVNTWNNDDDVVEVAKKTEAEISVGKMDENSPAALKLTVINPDASLWLLLSGGGASIAIADTVQASGFGAELGNYGEYSGGPTTEETYLYTKEILQLVLASSAPKKAIIIAGGVANFTDVAKTFQGIIQALDEVADELEHQRTKVFVRRGGPNEAEGLRLMEDFLKAKNLFGSVYGSDIVLTQAASDAISYVGESKHD